MTENRIYIKDYWNERDLILAFSRQDKDLIAIGEKLPNGAEKFTHIKSEDLEKIIIMKKLYITNLRK